MSAPAPNLQRRLPFDLVDTIAVPGAKLGEWYCCPHFAVVSIVVIDGLGDTSSIPAVIVMA